MRTFAAAYSASQAEPDRHPLARPDGGWYPGKPFDPTDILTDPRNWHVWRQFLIFTGLILTLPVALFVGSEFVLRRVFGLLHQQSQTIGAIVGVLGLQVFMFTYARKAFTEEQTEFAEQAKIELEKRRKEGTLNKLSEEAKEEDVKKINDNNKVDKHDKQIIDRDATIKKSGGDVDIETEKKSGGEDDIETEKKSGTVDVDTDTVNVDKKKKDTPQVNTDKTLTGEVVSEKSRPVEEMMTSNTIDSNLRQRMKK